MYYSLSEVLDYLLRQQTDQVTVLNFGVDAYGLDQSYLSYLHSPPAEHLNHIVYVFCGNDIRNLYENQLYDLAEDRALVSLDIPSRPWWAPLALETGSVLSAPRCWPLDVRAAVGRRAAAVRVCGATDAETNPDGALLGTRPLSASRPGLTMR